MINDFSDIQREEEKVKRSIKDAAKKGQRDVCVILAKELIQSRRAISKLYASKAHMNSVLLSMKNQLGECVKTTALLDWVKWEMALLHYGSNCIIQLLFKKGQLFFVVSSLVCLGAHLISILRGWVTLGLISAYIVHNVSIVFACF